jgi:hypothetical protein
MSRHLGKLEGKSKCRRCERLFIHYLFIIIYLQCEYVNSEDSMASSDWNRVTIYRKWCEKTRSLSNDPETWLDRPSRTVCIPAKIRRRPLHGSQYLCLSHFALRFEYLWGL